MKKFVTMHGHMNVKFFFMFVFKPTTTLSNSRSPFQQFAVSGSKTTNSHQANHPRDIPSSLILLGSPQSSKAYSGTITQIIPQPLPFTTFPNYSSPIFISWPLYRLSY